MMGEYFGYVNVPKDGTIQIQISNVTTTTNQSPSLNLYALNVVGQNGQSIGNYENNVVEVNYFDGINNGYSGNRTFKPNGIKSIGISSAGMSYHLKIVVIN